MALKEGYMVFHGTGKNEYSLTPNFAEGIVIKEIHIPSSVNDYLLVYIGKTLMGYYSIGADPIGNNLFTNEESSMEANVYNYLVKREVFRPYKVAEGETIIFRTQNGSNFDILVVYETYDSADVDPSTAGGSKSGEYDFVHYIYPSSVDIESVIDSTLTPSEFPAFPAGQSVPAGKEIHVHGIIGIPVTACDTYPSPTEITRTKAIKFIYNRKVLFDEEKIGIPFYGTSSPSSAKEYGVYLSQVSPCSSKDKREVFLFPSPLVFAEGEELDVRIVLEQVAGSTIQLNSSDLVIALIETVKAGG